MTRKSFKKFLTEAPVRDYETVGDFSKGSSFRKETDRKMITSEKAIKNVRKKFSKTPYEFNLIFVNSKKAKPHQEVGLVDNAWVRQNLDPEVAEKIDNYIGEDTINVIFTNNSADERVPMTPWIMVHRFAHAVRKDGATEEQYAYKEAHNHLISQVRNIFEAYGKNDFNPERRGYSDSDRAKSRKDQLAMMYMFKHMATFKSAREDNLRDWFEIINELIAQYIITGGIKFNPLPRCFGGGAFSNKQNYCTSEEELKSVNDDVATLSRDMEIVIDNVLSSAIGNTYVI
jgi:hypothetical protein